VIFRNSIILDRLHVFNGTRVFLPFKEFLYEHNNNNNCIFVQSNKSDINLGETSRQHELQEHRSRIPVGGCVDVRH
jgi:hypothetical protein